MSREKGVFVPEELNKDLNDLEPYKEPSLRASNEYNRTNPQKWAPVRRNDELNQAFGTDSDTSKYMQQLLERKGMKPRSIQSILRTTDGSHKVQNPLTKIFQKSRNILDNRPQMVTMNKQIYSQASVTASNDFADCFNKRHFSSKNMSI